MIDDRSVRWLLFLLGGTAAAALAGAKQPPPRTVANVAELRDWDTTHNWLRVKGSTAGMKVWHKSDTNPVVGRPNLALYAGDRVLVGPITLAKVALTGGGWVVLGADLKKATKQYEAIAAGKPGVAPKPARFKGALVQFSGEGVDTVEVRQGSVTGVFDKGSPFFRTVSSWFRAVSSGGGSPGAMEIRRRGDLARDYGREAGVSALVYAGSHPERVAGRSPARPTPTVFLARVDEAGKSALLYVESGTVLLSTPGFRDTLLAAGQFSVLRLGQRPTVGHLSSEEVQAARQTLDYATQEVWQMGNSWWTPVRIAAVTGAAVGAGLLGYALLTGDDAVTGTVTVPIP